MRPIRIRLDLDVLHLLYDVFVGPLADEIIYPLISLQQRFVPHASPKPRLVGQMTIVIPDLEKVFEDRRPFGKQLDVRFRTIELGGQPHQLAEVVGRHKGQQRGHYAPAFLLFRITVLDAHVEKLGFDVLFRYII